MNLKDFVKQSLLDITNGVAEAQSDSKLTIAPSTHDKSQLVNFEIAVTTSSEAEGQVTILSVVKAGGGVSSEAINRISFNVPIYLQNSKTEQ